MKTCHLILVILLLTTPRVVAADPVVFDVPGSVNTVPLDINDRGDIVGSFTTADGRQHGFLWSRGELTIIDAPNALSTAVTGVNNRGDMVGRDDSGGFALRRGRFERLLSPQGDALTPTDINNRGDIVGTYSPGGPHPPPPMNPPPILFIDGFLLDAHGRFTSIVAGPPGGDLVDGINDAGVIVGSWTDVGFFGGPSRSLPFLVDNQGEVTSFLLPGTVFPPQQFPHGINSAGHIVGSVLVPGQPLLGFDLYKGSATLISIPGALSVSANALNNRGDIVGAYFDGVATHGFVLSN
jgi:probable HAF family extracellular repeat protein